MNMSKDEIIELLQGNLRIEVSHPLHEVGYYDTHYELDEHNIEVKVFFGDTLICEGCS